MCNKMASECLWEETVFGSAVHVPLIPGACGEAAYCGGSSWCKGRLTKQEARGDRTNGWPIVSLGSMAPKFYHLPIKP